MLIITEKHKHECKNPFKDKSRMNQCPSVSRQMAAAQAHKQKQKKVPK